MQCGLCAVVAGFFRRAMCIAGSRRGSGESCYQELATEVQGQPTVRHTRIERRDRRDSDGKPTKKEHTATLTPLPVSTFVEAQFKEDEGERRSIERRSAEVTVDSQEQNAVFVRISEDAALASSGIPASLPESEDVRRRLSETDRVLLESLDVGECRIRHTARFLTMHKRRRKRLTTRSLNQEQGILDDIFHGLVQCVLQKAGNWRFNAFTLETVTGGRSLPVLCVHLFHWYGLLRHFNLDVVTVWKLFAFIEEGYHSTNPYHNSIHATDVTQAMHCFLQEEKIKTHLTSLEIMASLIAAVTHDLDHPGVNQPFLVATSNHLAALYQNTSVLENHHWRSAIGCLLESGVSDQLPPEVRPELQRHISSLILATDITRQQEFLTRFKHYLDDNLLDMKCPEDRHFILQIALKCADISNPCRPWDISRKWSYKVCEEFFRQGDYERQLNLPVTPLCDRRTTSIPKIQVGFFKFVVSPLYEEWHRFLGDGLSVSLMRHLRANQKKWEALIVQEAAQETETEISELEEAEDNVSSGDEAVQDEDSGSIDLLIPGGHSQSARRTSLPGKIGLERTRRRHSVPISISKPLSLFVRNGDRRESLPNEPKKNPPLSSSRLDEQSLLEPGSISLLSSRSSMLESSVVSTTERPVSAENLLPETSIASITNSAEASRLSSVLQPDGPKPQASQTKQLTRQQTFPPLQPYARMRYMSTTAEMSQCYTQILMEAETSSNSSASPTKDKSCSGGHCGTPPRANEVDSSWQKRSNGGQVTKEFLGIEWTEKSRTNTRAREQSNVEQRVDSFGIMYPRRHSMQTIRQEESSGKNRYKRPSSAQESTKDSARTFYESLTGSSSDRSSNVFNVSGFESRSDYDVTSENRQSSLKSIDDDQRTNVSSKRSDVGSFKSRYTESELRRHSTPANDSRTIGNDSGARRFTAIPVSSELSTHKVFFIGSPPDSPPRVQSGSVSSDSGGSEPRRSVADATGDCVSFGCKRDADSVREKATKIAKLSVDVQMKENVDPRSTDEFGKAFALSRRGSQGWAKRRGSAPVGLLSKPDDFTMISITSKADQNSRRGSVPIEISRHQGGGSNRLALGPRAENLPTRRRASLPQETTLGCLLGNISSFTADRENYTLNNNNINNTGSSNNNGMPRFTESPVLIPGMPSPRRGSVPADISELRRDLFNRSSINGKPRNRKKILRRRSSGGPEMFSTVSIDGNDNGMWTKCKRELGKRDSIPEPLVKRRGSLPIDMVAVSHTGSASGPRRSSLWRL